MSQDKTGKAPITVAEGFLRTRALIDGIQLVALQYITHEDPDYDLEARITRLEECMRPCYEELRAVNPRADCNHQCNGVCTPYPC